MPGLLTNLEEVSACCCCIRLGKVFLVVLKFACKVKLELAIQMNYPASQPLRPGEAYAQLCIGHNEFQQRSNKYMLKDGEDPASIL